MKPAYYVFVLDPDGDWDMCCTFPADVSLACIEKWFPDAQVMGW